MDIGTWPAWVSAACAAVSTGGSIWSLCFANRSSKARREAQVAKAQAQSQAKSAEDLASEARKQAESAQKLVRSLEEQVEAARASAKAAEEANVIAKKHIEVLEAQMKKADENNQVSIHWDYDRETPDERGLVTLTNVGTGTAHNFNATVGLYQDFEQVSHERLGPGETVKVFIQTLYDELTEYEQDLKNAKENAKRSPFQTSTYIPFPILKGALTVDATWTSPAGNPGRWTTN